MRRLRWLFVMVATLAGAPGPAAAQDAAPATGSQQDGAILLTVFLRHDETKTLGEIQDHLRETGFYQQFPPPGIRVVSWYVMMGVGQVVTLRVPPSRLREVNTALERTAWGAFRTEFYPTYDYRAQADEERRKAQ